MSTLSASHRQTYCRMSTPDRSNRVLVGDAITRLRELPPGLADTVITSPPYHLLRNYHAGQHEIGTEPSVHAYVRRLVTVFDELARVLKPTGSVWLNLGDSYSRHRRYGAPAKSLLLVPERLALALGKGGWIVRNRVAWTKPNPMPASVGDRLTASWEHLFFLVRQREYFFDLDSIREPLHTTRRAGRTRRHAKYSGAKPAWAGALAGSNDGLERAQREGRAGHPLGKNPSDTWHIPTAGFRGAHFAVYPEALIRRPLLATCPQRVCAACGRPWQRERRRDRLGGLRPACGHGRDWRPGLVLDPFLGSGTTAVVAVKHRRRWLGIELNSRYAAMARQRITNARASPPDRPAAN